MRKRIRRLVFVTGMLLILGVISCALQPAENTDPAETERTEDGVEAAHSTEEPTEAESTEERTEGETLSPEEQILADRRETVVECMRELLTVMWRAGVDIDYENHEGDSFSIKAGRIYRGMPYTNAAGTLTSFLEYAEKRDEKGVYLITGLNSEALDGGAAVVRVGSDCSSSVYTAWSQIGASVRCTATRYMCEDNGYIKVDETNNVVQQAAGRVRRGKNHEYDLQQFVTDVPGAILGGIDLSDLDEGNYRCTVVCRLTTGQEFMVRDFRFTK